MKDQISELIDMILVMAEERAQKAKIRAFSDKDLLSLHQELCETARELMTKKNADYKSGSGDPFANFRMSKLLGMQPEKGVLLRMQDKMARILTFLEKGELAVKEEPVFDCLLDLINYSVILGGLIKEKGGHEISVSPSLAPNPSF